MTAYQLVWVLYVIGGLGCGLAAWLLFRRLGREWGLFFMLTLWVLLLTPYALDKESMTLAPAIFILVMDGLTHGFESVKPIGFLLAAIWFVALILSLAYLLLTRSRNKVHPAAPTGNKKAARQQVLTHEEQQARDELLDGEIPIRAER